MYRKYVILVFRSVYLENVPNFMQPMVDKYDRIQAKCFRVLMNFAILSLAENYRS